MKNKLCCKCKCEKSVEEFYKDCHTKSGFSYTCKMCHALYDKKEQERKNELKRKNRANSEYRKLEYLRNKANNESKREHYLYRGAKARAKKAGIPFNIEVSDIIIPDICPLLNIPLEKTIKKGNPYTISLDKIDPNKGYVKGNIMVMSLKANVMKNNASLSELKTFSNNVLNLLNTDWGAKV